MSSWIGKPVTRLEDARLLTGRGAFMDDVVVPNLHHAAILRSPHAHARIVRVDASRALRMRGVRGVLLPEDTARLARPFGVGATVRIDYYPAAVDRVRFVGEPVAVVAARSRYLAEDALDAIEVEYEPLPAVVDPERGAQPDAAVLHDTIGSNVANHRVLTYGDVERAFATADAIVRTGRLVFPKYSSTPMEGYGIVADFDRAAGLLTIRSNFHGPFVMHPLVARALKLPENRLRFISPTDNGGSFGIKSSIFPYLALLGITAMKVGVPVKWIEDRREGLLASSSGTDRVSYLEGAFRTDGTLLGVRMKIYDSVGGYLRSPEPACLYRPTGNFVGAYAFQNLEMDCHAVHTTKSPTGPNRGYGCQQLYFGLERLMDLAAGQLGIDPAELRLRNLIPAEAMPYTTPTGGMYDSGDYPKALRAAMALADYDGLRAEQARARAAGRLFGIGVACCVDPSVSNMGYVTMAIDPETRRRPEYQAKSGAMETAVIRVDPMGSVTAVISTVPHGQGHETTVAQIIATELGLDPRDITVAPDFDSFTHEWSVATGTYSSRFASVTASAFAMCARQIRDKLFAIVGHRLGVPPEDLRAENGRIFPAGDPKGGMALKEAAGMSHWNPLGLPKGMDPGLQASYTYSFATAQPPDEHDRVDSSNTYGFIAEVVAVEVDGETGQCIIRKYVTVHDAGTILNPMIVEGQIQGGAMHGIGGAMYEELAYGPDGECLTQTFMDYLVPSATEAPKIAIDHVVSPSPLTTLGSKGLGESSSMTAPAVLANAVADALGVHVNELPLKPDRVWRWLRTRDEPARAKSPKEKR
jgi:2-furoyl-CoA dehydrogenase large subunit